MEFEVRDDAPWSRSLVFETHRDKLREIAAFIDSVERVELRSRTKHAGGRTELVHDWFGMPSALPALIRPFVPREMLRWKDTTVWCPHTWTAEWEIQTGFGPAIEAKGRNVYHPDGDRCVIELDGHFAFRPDRVPELSTVPATAVPMVEQFVVKLIVPMIQQSGKAVKAYLEDQGVPHG